MPLVSGEILICRNRERDEKHISACFYPNIKYKFNSKKPNMIWRGVRVRRDFGAAEASPRHPTSHRILLKLNVSNYLSALLLLEIDSV